MDWGDLTCTVEMDWWGFGWDSGPFALSSRGQNQQRQDEWTPARRWRRRFGLARPREESQRGDTSTRRRHSQAAATVRSAESTSTTYRIQAVRHGTTALTNRTSALWPAAVQLASLPALGSSMNCEHPASRPGGVC